MKRALIILTTTLLLMLAYTTRICAQTEISGYTEDSITHSRLGNVSITLLRNGKPVKFARTKADGTFTITTAQKQQTDTLTATCMGYKKQRTAVADKGETVIRMSATAFVLNEVQVKGARVYGKDTVAFDLTRFADERDNSLKDVLKKLPGVDVEKNGSISYNGKPIDRFTVEGLDLTGGKYGQLEENIKAKDVRKAEIINHDQPIKALQDRTFTDDVAMNISLKDGARDKLMPVIKPYMLVGHPTHVGGSVNVMQIGKKRQMMYDVEYNRSGADIGSKLNELTNYSGRLAATSMPSWIDAPKLDTPIDAERMRFNTSQKYSVNNIQKNSNDTESRIEASYVRQLQRQQKDNVSTYDLGGSSPIITSEHNRKTMTSDALNIEYEKKVNQTTHYGNDYLKLNANKDDGLSSINDTLTQHVRIPSLNIEAGLYRLFVWKRSQLSWRSTIDYHHGTADLDINDDRQRIRTNLWHTAHTLTWLKKRMHWTQQYQAAIDVENVNALGNSLDISGTLSPLWQYKAETFRMIFSPSMIWKRFTRPQKTLFAVAPYLYIYKKVGFHSELTANGGYSIGTSTASRYAISNYRRDYRSWFQNDDIIPITKSLYGRLSYDYKRPIKELFFSASVNGSRAWMNTASDLRIDDGNYYTTIYKKNTCYNNVGASLYVSKGVYSWHLKTSLTAAYNYSEGKQYTAGNGIDYKANSYTLTPEIYFSPKWCAFSYEGVFALHNTKHQQMASSSLFDWKQTVSATATIKNVDLTVSLVHYRNELQQGQRINTLLGDASAVWRMKKLRLSAELRNIFNKKTYAETTYSGISTLTNSYNLRPRELMITAEYSF